MRFLKGNKNRKKINTSLEFKTNKEENGHKRMTFALFFGVGIVILACVCLLLFLKEYDFDIDNIVGRKPETTSEASTENMTESFEGNVNVLVLCSDDDGKAVHHAAVVNVDLGKSKIKIHTLNVREKVNVGGYSASLSDQLAHGGMPQFLSAVRELSSMEIDRYIRATDTSFKSLIKIFGGIPCNVSEKIGYSVDGVGYIIEKGEQTLTADMSYKYMYYLSQQNENKPDEMSEFLGNMLSVFLTEDNMKSADSLYKRLVNFLDTDISAFDYSNNKAALSHLISNFQGKKAEIYGINQD